MQWAGYCYFMLQVYTDCRNYVQPDSVLRLLTQNWTGSLGTHKPVKSVEETQVNATWKSLYGKVQS